MTLVRMWEAEAGVGRAAELIRWLHDDVVPAALATQGCVGAEGFAGDDRRAVLITRWSDREACQEWDEGHHPAVHRCGAWTFVPLAEAKAEIEGA